MGLGRPLKKSTVEAMKRNLRRMEARKRGRGWHGESRRHSEAAKKGRKLLLDRPAGEAYKALAKDLPERHPLGGIHPCPHDNICLIDGVWRCGECGLVEAEIAARERAAEYDPGAGEP